MGPTGQWGSVLSRSLAWQACQLLWQACRKKCVVPKQKQKKKTAREQQRAALKGEVLDAVLAARVARDARLEGAADEALGVEGGRHARRVAKITALEPKC